MVLVQITVHVPLVSRTRTLRSDVDAAKKNSSVLDFAATAPEKEVPDSTTSNREFSRHASSGSINLNEEVEEEFVDINYGKRMRNFMINAKSIVDFVGEVGYLNGSTRWSMFVCTCNETFAEECLKRLANLGIGVKGGGAGIINVVSLHSQRIAAIPIPREPVVGHTGFNPSRPSISRPGTTTMTESDVMVARSELALEPVPQENESLEVGAAAAAAAAAAATGPNTVSPPMSPQTESGVVPETKSFEEIPPLGSQQGSSSSEMDEDEFLDEVHMSKDEFDPELGFPPGADGQVGGFTSRFRDTIKSRIAVDKVIDLVGNAAEFSFDYVSLVLVASILACIGLVTNNVVVIVASMLVSPLMGPILAVTFGAVMYDKSLIKLGLFSELVGLCLCMLVGLVGGFCAIPVNGDTLPTLEMTSRMYPSSVIVGICIAIPSGVGVALSVLGNNTSSLVGVAISASLLPPAVNTGILLALAAMSHTEYVDLEKIDQENPNSVTLQSVLKGAGWSLLLTIANILCIWVAGILMFKLKEVSPLDQKSEFWTTHVPNTRMYNTVFRKGDAETEKFREAVKTQLKQHPESLGTGYDVFSTLNALNARNEHKQHHTSVIDASFFAPPEEEGQKEKKPTAHHMSWKRKTKFRKSHSPTSLRDVQLQARHQRSNSHSNVQNSGTSADPATKV